MLRIDGELVLDTWTARREVERAARRTALGRSPGAALLADLPGPGAAVPGPAAQREPRVGGWSTSSSSSIIAPRRWRSTSPASRPRWRTGRRSRSSRPPGSGPRLRTRSRVAGQTLPEVGVTELPPAGYLGFTVAGRGRPCPAVPRLRRHRRPPVLRGPGGLRRRCGAGGAAPGPDPARPRLGPEAAGRHPGAQPKRRPGRLEDRRVRLGGLRAEQLGRLRRPRRSPEEPKTEDVEIAEAFLAFDDGQEMMRRETGRTRPHSPFCEFAENSADVPAGATKPSELDVVDSSASLAAASTEDAAKLAVQRADALIAAWNLGTVAIRTGLRSALRPAADHGLRGRQRQLTPAS